jgi:hypothetical protein
MEAKSILEHLLHVVVIIIEAGEKNVKSGSSAAGRFAPVILQKFVCRAGYAKEAVERRRKLWYASF